MGRVSHSSGPAEGTVSHEASHTAQQRSSGGIEKADGRRGTSPPSEGGGGGSGGGDRAQDYNSSRSNAEYNYDRASTTNDPGPSKEDPKRDLDTGGSGEERLTVNEEGVEEDVGDRKDKGRKSGNESSAIGTLR
jgi:hypothetical protein